MHPVRARNWASYETVGFSAGSRYDTVEYRLWRFCSALNLDVHFHMLLLDGVFGTDADSVRWVRVPPPTTDQVQKLVTHIARTVERSRARHPGLRRSRILQKPYTHGTTHFIFSEVELAQKLSALVPPNRKNGVTYHGVLAQRHRLRNQVIPEPPEPNPENG